VSKINQFTRPLLLSFFGILLLSGINNTQATVISKIENTKHNLSTTGPGTARASTNTKVCIFCHAAHSGEPAVAPLWNRTLSTLTYALYDSSSLEATTSQPSGDSKLCLSCHDGTLALGTVSVANGLQNAPAAISMTGAPGGFIPTGSGEFTSDTRDIGSDLSNDHPISFTYDNTLATNDGELRTLPVTSGSTTHVGNSVKGTNPKPTLPLKSNQMECTTCHDPHTWEDDPTKGNHKFLRGSRFQQTQPMGGNFEPTVDSMCLGCHEKLSALWAYSAHANESIASQTYLTATATQHEFPTDATVWSVSCLNCHDTHSVQGSRRLLREGTDSTATPKSGGNSAIEETCYQCHSAFGDSVITPLTTVPDIKSDFASTIHMPIAAAPEAHDISGNFNDTATGGAACSALGGDQCGKDFLETQATLGKVSAGGAESNRHAECSDCHNPHRTTKNRLFNDDPAFTIDDAGTHKHNIIAGDSAPHNNLASGSLRGTFGIEPVYFDAKFSSSPTSFDIKRGDGGNGASTFLSNTYVTREYQICLKCHSDYGYDTSSPIALPISNIDGGTASGTNGVTDYSDIATEIQAPIGHKGSPISTSDSGADAAFSTNNHRSWHPVMDNTGRTSLLRGNASPNLLRAPFNGSDTDGGSEIVTALGEQTMHCSDCHGSDNALSDGAIPTGGENGQSWGPHGSDNDFLLKGPWDTAAAVGAVSDNLCFRCHEANQYADATGAPATVLQSGFSATGNDAYGVAMTNLHQRHAYYTTQGGSTVPPITWPTAANGTYRCSMCHTGSAHGWKNKEFLVNLDDLGPEITALGGEITPGSITLVAGDSVPTGTQAPAFTIPTGYSNGPYYQGALLRVNSFGASGTWVKADCGGCH